MYDTDPGYEAEAIESERLDADILQAQYEAEGREYDRLRRAGYCVHGSSVGAGNGKGPLPGGLYYPEQEGLRERQHRCTDRCGRVFDSLEELMEAEPTLIQSVGDDAS